MAAQRIPPQHLLHLQGKRWEALAHIGVAGRQPHPHARGNRDHRRRPSASAATAAVSVAWSIEPVIRIRVPLANSISMAPPPAGPAGAGTGSAASGSRATTAGTKPLWCSAAPLDRKSVVEGKRVYVSVDLGGRRTSQK